MKSLQSGSYQRLASLEALWWAWRDCRRGKRRNPTMSRFEIDCDRHLLALQRELLDHRYRPSPWRLHTIHDPKTRLIAAPAVRDRVLHHALLHEIGPTFERRFIDQSFAAGRHRGAHRAVLYFLRCQRRHAWRLHLDGLDHFVKRTLKIPGYQRYMDDFVLFADDKTHLIEARTAIAAWLQEARALDLNPQHLAIAPTRIPAVFLGYRVSRAGISPSRKLRRHLRDRLRAAAARGEEALFRTLQSYQGLLLFP